MDSLLEQISKLKHELLQNPLKELIQPYYTEDIKAITLRMKVYEWPQYNDETYNFGEMRLDCDMTCFNSDGKFMTAEGFSDVNVMSFDNTDIEDYQKVENLWHSISSLLNKLHIGINESYKFQY